MLRLNVISRLNYICIKWRSKYKKDYYTNQFLPDQIFFKIDRENIVKSAVKQIEKILNNPIDINNRKLKL